MTLIKSISGIRGTIGGIVGNNLTPPDIVKYTTAYAKFVKNAGQNTTVVVGRDARLSGSMVSGIVTATLQAMGLDVIDLGLSTTPSVELAVKELNAGGGIIITASHNPKQWNALKLLNANGEFLNPTDAQNVLELSKDTHSIYDEVHKLGTVYHRHGGYIDRHIERILELKLVNKTAIQNKNFTIVVDAVNSVGGIAVPKLLQALGVQDIITLHCEPTGQFAHNPEPLPENLGELAQAVKNHKADLGISVDPDVDRLAIVCENGDMFGEEYTLVAVAQYVLMHTPGNTVSNLSSTGALRVLTEKAGGQYNASAVGEVNVVSLMKETQAVIGGEGNGGVIYPPMHYGRDALTGIALLLSHLATMNKKVSTYRASLPSFVISKNKISIDETIDPDYILEQIQEKYKRNPLITVDGVRINFDDEWVHLRKSNTEPIIRIYAESKSETKADNLARKIMMDIGELMKNKK